MNCATGPTPTPCNHCKSCTEIIAGHNADVFEIDGASNNSVDQIRDLRENVTYLPASAPYKIYIIDEVHMLPQPHSTRCSKRWKNPGPCAVHLCHHRSPQDSGHNPVPVPAPRPGKNPFGSHFRAAENICAKEGFSVDAHGLDLIALEADGSVRDALSLLDRILSAAPEKKISLDMVVDRLGVLDRRIMHELIHALFEKDMPALISVVDRVNDTGVDLKNSTGT